MNNENRITEEFLVFIDISNSTTGKILINGLLAFICKIGLDSQKMRTQCYRGAENVPGKVKGVGSRIRILVCSSSVKQMHCEIL